MEITGTIKTIMATQTVSDKFSKREFVVTTEETYPQHVLIQVTQDKCNVLNAYKVGDKVTVGINIRGREWQNPQGETKYFNTIEGWRIAKVDGGAVVSTPVANAPVQDDDLPF